MTISQAINYLRQELLAVPVVKCVVNDITMVNDYPDLKYMCAALDMGLTDKADKHGITSMSMSIALFDIQKDGPSDSTSIRNENDYIDLYSKAVVVFETVFANLEKNHNVMVADCSFQPFQHRYVDVTAGALALVTFKFPATICWEEDFNPVPPPVVEVTLNASVTNGSLSAVVSGSPVQLPYAAPIGTRVVLTVTPDSGYEFTHWSDASTENPRSFYMLSDTTLTCECTVPTVKHIISASASNCIITGAGMYDEGAQVVLSVIPYEHYHLSEGAWSGLPSSATFNADFTAATFNADADYTVIVNAIEDDKYTLTFNGNSCACYPSSFIGYIGDTVEVTVLSFAEHYHWGSWNDLSTDNPRTFTVEGSGIYTANTVEDSKYTLTFSASNGSVSPTTFTGYTGDQVSASVTPDTDYTWSKWNDDDTSNPRTFTIGTTSQSFNGICVPVVPTTHTVTATATHGTITGAGTYNYGDQVTMIVTLDDPSRYYCYTSSWSGLPAGTTFTVNNTRATFTITSDLNISVTPVRFPTLIYFDNHSPEYGSLSCKVNGVEVESPTGAYPGDVVTLTATPIEGCMFCYWYNIENNQPYFDNPHQFTIAEDDMYYSFELYMSEYHQVEISTSSSHPTGMPEPTVTGGGTYEYGDSVTVTASEPPAGYHFMGWYNDGYFVSSNLEYAFNAGWNTGSGYFVAQYSTNDIFDVFPLAVECAPYEQETHFSVAAEDDIVWTLSYPSTTGLAVWPTSGTGTTDITILDERDPEDFDRTTNITVATTDARAPQQIFTVVYTKKRTPTPPPTQSPYLVFISEGTSFINLYHYGSSNPNCEYSLDGLTGWTTLGTTAVEFHKIYVRGTNTTWSSGSSHFTRFVLSGDPVNVTGRVGALLDNGACTQTSAPQFCFYRMFNGCTLLKSATGILDDITTLANYCYASMFYDCTSLESAPNLPATTLTNYCYETMFFNCTSLTTAPELPATTLALGCYKQMFSGCTSLTGPVRISATSPYFFATATACTEMFYNSGTSRPSTPTDYNKIKVGGNVSDWNSANAGIDTTYWTVELL